MVKIADHHLTAALQGAPWVVVVAGESDEEMFFVAILQHAWLGWAFYDDGANGGCHYAVGELHECRSLRNAHRLARRLRKKYDLHYRLGWCRRWERAKVNSYGQGS